jgi:hypothetical protein
LASAFPINYIMMLFADGSDGDVSGGGGVPPRTLKMLRLAKLLKLLRIVRAFRIIKVRNRHSLSAFHLKLLMLPRQARDKHRENTPKKCRFLAAS